MTEKIQPQKQEYIILTPNGKKLVAGDINLPDDKYVAIPTDSGEIMVFFGDIIFLDGSQSEVRGRITAKEFQDFASKIQR